MISLCLVPPVRALSSINSWYEQSPDNMTGYTGLKTAEHISAHFPTNLKWAVAGRSAQKLQKVVADCKQLNGDRVQPGTMFDDFIGMS